MYLNLKNCGFRYFRDKMAGLIYNKCFFFNDAQEIDENYKKEYN